MAERRIGSWVAIRLLGRGASGEVHEARDERGRRCALKLAGAARDVADLERFEREARAASRIAHPNVARVLDAGVAGGVRFIAYELVAGESLAERLRREGRLEPREAVRIAREIASALEAVHAAGVVHRDVKPANVLLASTGETKLADFGLARIGARGSLTKTGDVLGTLAYMAPEQANGEVALDGRADVYALGVVLFEMLAGETPFTGSGYALVKKHLLEPAPAPSSRVPGIDRRLDGLVLALLAKKPDERPTAAEVRERLERLADGKAFEAPGARRSPGALVVVAGVLALGAVGAALVVRARSRGPGATPATPDAPAASAVSPAPKVAARPTPAPAPTPAPTPRVDPEDVPPAVFPGTAQACAAASLAALEKKHPRAALALAERALAQDPQSSDGLWARYLASVRLGSPVVPHDPGAAEGERLAVAADGLLHEGRSEEALAEVERALALRWTGAWLWSLRGACRAKLGDPSGGRADQERALALDSQCAIANLRLGDFAVGDFELGNDRALDDAIEHYSRALESKDGYYYRIAAYRKRADCLTRRATRVASTDPEAARADRKHALADLGAALEVPREPLDDRTRAEIERGIASLEKLVAR